MSITPSPHPPWCDLTLCTAADPGFGAAHRSQAVTFTAPMVEIRLSLFQAVPGWPTDVHLSAVVGDRRPGGAQVATTLPVADAWRFVDVLTGLLDRTRERPR